MNVRGKINTGTPTGDHSVDLARTVVLETLGTTTTEVLGTPTTADITKTAGMVMVGHRGVAAAITTARRRTAVMLTGEIAARMAAVGPRILIPSTAIRTATTI